MVENDPHSNNQWNPRKQKHPCREHHRFTLSQTKLPPLLVDCDGLYVVCLLWRCFNFPRTQWVCKNRLLVITPDHLCLKYWVDAAVGMHISACEGRLFLRAWRSSWRMLLKISLSVVWVFYNIVVMRHLHTSQPRSWLGVGRRNPRG